MAPRRLLILTIALAAATAALVSCDDKAGALVEPVQIEGQWFHLELAVDNAVRLKGLGGRDYIAPDGGMLFVFSNAQVRAFVMRDCPIPIDIAFLDAAGRVVAMYPMTPEAPRGEDEPANTYERRLRQYSSRFPTRYVIETAGGRLGDVKLKVGDRVRMDTRRLRTMAR